MNNSSSCSCDRGRWAPSTSSRARYEVYVSAGPVGSVTAGTLRRHDGVTTVALVLAIFDISTGYQILGFLHVLAVIIAFGPVFFYPSLQRAGAGPTLAKLHLRLVLPAL